MLEPLTNHYLMAPLLALLTVAVITDIHHRLIPNVLVVIGLVIGIAGHTWLSGVAGFVTATIGACVGLLCLLPFYISGGMGAGDVKLMAAVGALGGPLGSLWTIYYALWAASAYAMGLIIYCSFRKKPIPKTIAFGACLAVGGSIALAFHSSVFTLGM